MSATRCTATPVAPGAAAWANRIVGHADVPPGELLAHPLNPRRHPERQRRAMRGSLDEVGWVQSVMVSVLTGRIIDGHLRVEESLAKGEPTIPVEYVQLDADEERKVLASFDPIGALAEIARGPLVELLAGLTASRPDLQGFLADFAAANGVGLALGGDLDQLPDLVAPDETYVRPGDLWAFGTHRVVCGDALDEATVTRLLSGEAPTLLIADPPYGVELNLARRHDLDAPATGRSSRRGRGHRNVELLGDTRGEWSDAIALVPSIEVGYVWRPALSAASVLAGLERLGFEAVSEIVWRKTRFSVGRRWYHWQHETCLVVRRRGARLGFLGTRDQGTVWDAPSPKLGGRDADRKEDHPAQKPLAVIAPPIRNHLHPGEAVYDPFLGSGTTLIAAELSSRRCLGVELDPRFVQLAIERWQRLTGGTAELLEGGI